MDIKSTELRIEDLTSKYSRSNNKDEKHDYMRPSGRSHSINLLGTE